MATFFNSTAYLSLPLTRTHHHLASSSHPPPPSSPPPPNQSSSSSQLSTGPSEIEKLNPVVKTAQQPKSNKKTTSTNADSTDWIASSLTRRFGLGAGLAWAAFLAVGVVSEQIKTRLEVSQEQANTRSLYSLSSNTCYVFFIYSFCIVS